MTETRAGNPCPQLNHPHNIMYTYRTKPHPKHGYLAEVINTKKGIVVDRKHVANEELAEAACRYFKTVYDTYLANAKPMPNLQWESMSVNQKVKYRQLYT